MRYHPQVIHIVFLLSIDITLILLYSLITKCRSRVLPNARPDNGAMKPVELWGYEGSPFVRPVREVLNSLALPHLMVYSGRGSSNRDVMREKTSRFQVPYLEDPNTGIKMFESGAIVKYLMETYTTD